MSIITISQGTFTHGREVAEQLAKRLNYQILSRDLILETCEEFSVPEKRLRKALHDAPSLFDRFSHEKDRYVSLFRSILMKHLLDDNIVYFGLAGHFLVQDIDHVCKVRIIADIESRVRHKAWSEGIDDEQARYIIRKDDDERRRWSRALFNKDTWDSTLYDLVINIDTISVDDAVTLLAEIIEGGSFDGNEHSRQKVKKLTILSAIHADMVATAPKVSATIEDDVLVLRNLEGYLVDNSDRRRELRDRYIREYGLKDVVFRGDSHDRKDYVNTFYNLDI